MRVKSKIKVKRKKIKTCIEELRGFDSVELLTVVEGDLESFKKSRLAQEANSELVHPGSKSSVEGELDESLKIYRDTDKVRRDIRTSNTGSHVDWSEQWIQPEWLHK